MRSYYSITVEAGITLTKVGISEVLVHITAEAGITLTKVGTIEVLLQYYSGGWHYSDKGRNY